MSLICAVHLVRKTNGIEPFRTFLESYRHRPAGMEHELLIVFKGFADGDVTEYAGLLSLHPHHSLLVPDSGFDIGPYFRAVEQFDHRYFVFLNSFSVLLCDGWMAKLHQHARQPGVGAVGASGSWESLSAPIPRAGRTGWVRRLRTGLKQARARKQFPDFPNYHLRTNAFMAPREILRMLRVPDLQTKEDAHCFESGVGGLSGQLLALNKRLLIVGCDGRAYEKEQWPASGTFRSGEQKNLLVADNQTRLFAQADSETRLRLTAMAWGSPSAVTAQ